MRNAIAVLLIVCCTSVAYGATYYLDPVNGSLTNDGSLNAPWSSLEQVITANMIASNEYAPLPYDPATSEVVPKNANGAVKAGDTLVLLSGLHGEVFLQNYINTEPITITAKNGHSPIIEKVRLQACKHWVFDNLKISTEEYGYYVHDKLFFIESHKWQGPSSHVIVKNCELYSTTTPWTTAEEWVNKASDGIYINGNSVIAINNILVNVRMGITASGNYIIAERNRIINFSGDGMRLLGSHNVFKSNLIKNCYDVDDNHDDGIQSWTTNGIVVDNNQVIGNIIINTDNPTRPLNGSLQGIGCFDGFYNNWIVANNVISVNHWHGITFLGAHNCQIINNTVIDPTPDITPGGSWIRIDKHKNGTPSSNCIVANNVANSFVVDGVETHNTVLDTYQQYEANFVDYKNFDFHLTPHSVLIDAGFFGYAVEDDIENNPRVSGKNPDIGAYEFIGSTTSVRINNEESIQIYPNPFHNEICIDNAKDDWIMELYDISGKMLFTSDNEGLNEHLKNLKDGLYFLKIVDHTHTIVLVRKLVRY